MKVFTPAEQGNVLFLILIAVALFAALSYAVTSSMRGTGGDTKAESVELRAAQILQYGAGLRAMTQKMVLMGLTPETIRFRGTQSWLPCSDGTKFCVFGPNGGGAAELRLPMHSSDKFDNLFRYSDISDGMVVKDVGTSAADIVLYRVLKFDESGRSMCAAINKGLGLDDIPTQPSSTNAYHEIAAFPGQTAGCFRYASDSYFYFQSVYDN